ncbi:hypothetical protein BMS3Abin08_01692 [bacterium BMS3Abin08]|nr:hypothetical protein BMS3Abin08_01692 [bacterium BMS3Abin08]
MHDRACLYKVSIPVIDCNGLNKDIYCASVLLQYLPLDFSSTGIFQHIEILIELFMVFFGQDFLQVPPDKFDPFISEHLQFSIVTFDYIAVLIKGVHKVGGIVVQDSVSPFRFLDSHLQVHPVGNIGYRLHYKIFLPIWIL